MNFTRILDLNRYPHSAFLFGPRMTGKTHLLKEFKEAHYFDLLDPEAELELKRTPRLFWERLSAVQPGALVIVDEIQRVPALLDYVQKGIEEKQLRFILSGSSARKLKRGSANLLGGRAIELRLHPLTFREIGKAFRLEAACQYGTLPRITQLWLENQEEALRLLLRSYYTTYIKEEIQAEALTRNVGAFQRFLLVAVQSNAQVIEFSNIARDCSVPASTVKEYFSILEDTLIGEFLWPWDRSERRKARPKFYFFDCGVVRAIQNRLIDPPTTDEFGFLFETWMVREFIRLRDYLGKPHEFAFWREGPHEIDLLVMRSGKPILAVEFKSSSGAMAAATLTAFRQRFGDVPILVASSGDRTARQLENGLSILPWSEALERYEALV